MMGNKKPIAIVFLTYQRTGYAVKTIRTAAKYLMSCDREFVWYVADDGSDPDHLNAVLNAMKQHRLTLVGHHSERMGYGRSANTAYEFLKGITPLTLWLEDDWRSELYCGLDNYATMLEDNQDIGMVRLGHLPIDLEARSIGRNGHVYLEILKTRQYTYSGNPHIKHARFFDAYGGWPEGKNPGDTEIEYDHTIRHTDGPAIVWPIGIGDQSPFAHIGEVKSYG